MLEALHTIDWSQISGCDGPAIDIPLAIQDITSKDAKVRLRGRNILHVSLEDQGLVHQAAAYAVPFLLEVLADPQVQDKCELVLLLAFLGSEGTYFAYFGHQFLSLERRLAQHRTVLRESREPPVLQETNYAYKRWGESAHQAVREGLPLFLLLLADPDPMMRMKIAFLLTFFPENRSWLSLLVLTQFKAETHEYVQCCLLFGLGHLLSSTPDASTLLMRYLMEGGTELLRFTAAMVLCVLCKEETPEEAVHVLLHALVAPGFLRLADEHLPPEWTSCWSSMQALFYLDQLTSSPHRSLILERLVEGFPILDEHIELDCADLLLRVAFYEKGFQPYAPFADLDPMQQTILHILVAKETLWAKPDFDLFLDETITLPPVPVRSLAYLGFPAVRQHLQAFITKTVCQ